MMLIVTTKDGQVEIKPSSWWMGRRESGRDDGCAAGGLLQDFSYQVSYWPAVIPKVRWQWILRLRLSHEEVGIVVYEERDIPAYFGFDNQAQLLDWLVTLVGSHVEVVSPTNN